MTDEARLAERDHDHRWAGEVIRAALRPGERLLEHSLLLRSPGVEEPPPTAGEVLNAFNPFAGFTETARSDGVGLALLQTAFGLTPSRYDMASIMANDKIAARYGYVFCGVAESEAGRLRAAIVRHATMDHGHRAAYLARTDQRVVLFADPVPAPGDHPDPDRPLLEMLLLPLRLAIGLWDAATNQPEPTARARFSGSLRPVFECPPTAIAAAPAPPLEHMPRATLWFADRSWMVVSLGTGDPAARMYAALQPHR
ncbi:hypothetical protein [Actinoplanes sp. NPDC051851]|uniref:hypothetical protein n=1 Tax=Actinoplanes sp. NPDC051851 TaxID=3154753 RepID=UPI00342B4391